METRTKMCPADKNPAKRILAKESGYTLVEVILVLLLMFLVVSIITMTYFISANASKQVIDTASAEMDARTTMYALSKQIRGAFQITHAEKDSISFISGTHEGQHGYFLQAHQDHYRLYESLNGQDRLLATDIVEDNLFSYYSASQAILDTPLSPEQLSEIAAVGIEIVINRTGAPAERTMALDTLVTLRNH